MTQKAKPKTRTTNDMMPAVVCPDSFLADALLTDGKVDRCAAVQGLIIAWPSTCYAFAHCPDDKAEAFAEIYHAHRHLLDRLGLIDAQGKLHEAEAMLWFEQGNGA